MVENWWLSFSLHSNNLHRQKTKSILNKSIALRLSINGKSFTFFYSLDVSPAFWKMLLCVLWKTTINWATSSALNLSWYVWFQMELHGVRKFDLSTSKIWNKNSGQFRLAATENKHWRSLRWNNLHNAISSWETLKNYLVRGVQFGGWHLQETLRHEFYVVIYRFFQCCLVFTSFDAFIRRIDKRRYWLRDWCHVNIFPGFETCLLMNRFDHFLRISKQSFEIQ